MHNLSLAELTETINDFNENFEVVIAVSRQNPKYRVIGILNLDEGSLSTFDGGGNSTTYTKGEIDECFQIHSTSFLK